MRRTNIIWLTIYFVWTAVLVGGLFQARSYTIENLTSDASQAEWQRFKEEQRPKSGVDGPVEGPVQRRVPKPDEPPQLLLLRDYFGTCLAGTLLFGSALFVMLMVAIRGALAKPRQ